MRDILTGLNEHFCEARKYFPSNNIVGIFLQGSQNYGLETPYSDIDTKLIVTPTIEDLVMNKSAVSTTHIRENEEHIDLKDIRLMFQTFRKQNLNFLEILFTRYFLVNPLYKEEWDKIIENREAIAHYNIYNAVKAMKGIALEKYHAMEHRYPLKIAVIDKYGYDPKQLHHLIRVREYLERYINGEPYQDCLRPKDPKWLIDVKLGKYSLSQARMIADRTLKDIDIICEPFTKDSHYNKNDYLVDKLLDEVQTNIMIKSIKIDLKEKE